ncbi:MAG: hypothetical protein IPK19_37805 [Chloroflexi bacterium]|nr:hypothetical protein [Chloroflexota bacterium]
MDRRQMCIANVQYRKPGATESKRANGLLRYLTYREVTMSGRPLSQGGSAGRTTAWDDRSPRLPLALGRCAVSTCCSSAWSSTSIPTSIALVAPGASRGNSSAN